MFALRGKDYESLSRNTAEMIRWAKEASYQIDFYRRTRQPASKDSRKDGK